MTDPMDMDIYADPENLKEILDELKLVSSEDEEYQFTMKHLPGWLVASYDRYSSDYPKLDENWKEICEKVRMPQKKIVAVSIIPLDDQHILVHLLCERFTRSGYMVRRAEELQGCAVCGAALPSREVWKHMRRKGLPCPDKWGDKCSSC